MADSNIIIIIVAFFITVVAIYILYSIILFQGKSSKGDDLQLSTKNILEQVQVLFDKKEYALAQLLATKYLDRVPGHLEVRIYLAKAYYEDKKYNQAIKQCGIILKKKPKSLETHKILGNCYIRKQLLSRAVEQYEYIFEHDSSNKEIIITLAELYKDIGQLFSAINTYSVLADMATDDSEIADIQSILAGLNEEVHDYPAAFEAYKTRLGIYPNDVNTNRKLAELYIRIKNYPVAIETLLYMLSFVTEPKVLLWIYETIVELYTETENYEKAIEYSEKMLDIQGSDKFKIRDNIALFNLKLNKVDEGITILEDLSMMSQNGFEVTVELAGAYIKKKDYEKALEKYNLLMDKATPKEAKILNALICELYIFWAIDKTENKKIEDALDCLKSAAQYNPLNPEIYYNTAKIYYNNKNYNNAVEVVNQALELDKTLENHPKYLLLLADIHKNLNNTFEEKKALMDLLKLDEKNPEGLYRSGLMYVSQSDMKDAEEAFRKALQYKPDLLEAKYNLAMIYEINNREKAKELYMEILEANPSFEEARRALNDMATSEFGF